MDQLNFQSGSLNAMHQIGFHVGLAPDLAAVASPALEGRDEEVVEHKCSDDVRWLRVHAELPQVPPDAAQAIGGAALADDLRRIVELELAADARCNRLLQCAHFPAVLRLPPVRRQDHARLVAGGADDGCESVQEDLRELLFPAAHVFNVGAWLLVAHFMTGHRHELLDTAPILGVHAAQVLHAQGCLTVPRVQEQRGRAALIANPDIQDAIDVQVDDRVQHGNSRLEGRQRPSATHK
mmetsp:Transcript_49271/g.143414  ORF Transcript_49271/g.143414 Transcript_49271/m.143414 type:complete len:238 (-) Transcript_49271:16-729(-)